MTSGRFDAAQPCGPGIARSEAAVSHAAQYVEVDLSEGETRVELALTHLNPSIHGYGYRALQRLIDHEYEG